MLPQPHPNTCRTVQRLTVWWNLKIREALARYEKVPVSQIHFAPDSKTSVKFLNWRVWGIRYSVTLDFILEVMCNYFKNVRARARKGNSKVITLGLPYTAVTGPKAREILVQAIAIRYPQGENRAMVRSDLQNRMVRLTTAQVDFGDGLEKGFYEYRAKIEKKRNNAVEAHEKYNRPWRGNPWR